MSVKKRLKEYLKYKSVSATEFGRVIGVSAAFVNSIRVSIQPDKIESIALKYPDLNTEWLLTGRGSMLKEDAIKNNSILNVGDGNISNMGSGSFNGSINVNSNQELLRRIAELERTVADKDKALADKDKMIADRDTTIENLKYIIENMRK